MTRVALLLALAACGAPSTSPRPTPVVANVAPEPPACATLAIHVAEEMSSYMEKVAAAVAAAKPPRVRVETDEWGHRPGPLGGTLHFDHRLVATERLQIENVLRDLARTDSSIVLPEDRMLVYEHRAGEWRSYYVERAPTVVNADVATAEATGDRLVLTLTAAAKHTLEDQTAKNVERKLAVMLDGVVIVTPLIPGTNTTGRLEIALPDAAAANVLAARLACPR